MRIPGVQVQVPSREMGTFFLHTVGSIFRLSMTHARTHMHVHIFIMTCTRLSVLSQLIKQTDKSAKMPELTITFLCCTVIRRRSFQLRAVVCVCFLIFFFFYRIRTGPRPTPFLTKFVAFRMNVRTFEVTPYILEKSWKD